MLCRAWRKDHVHESGTGAAGMSDEGRGRVVFVLWVGGWGQVLLGCFVVGMASAAPAIFREREHSLFAPLLASVSAVAIVGVAIAGAYVGRGMGRRFLPVESGAVDAVGPPEQLWYARARSLTAVGCRGARRGAAAVVVRRGGAGVLPGGAAARVLVAARVVAGGGFRSAARAGERRAAGAVSRAAGVFAGLGVRVRRARDASGRQPDA